jgi:molecular chaperone GrpE
MEQKDGREGAAAKELGQTPEGERQGQSPEELRQELEAERARADSYLASWQRAQADFMNLRRRTEQERTEAGRYAGAVVVSTLLPVVDDLERAVATIPPQLYAFTWADGVRLIHRKLLALLESHGVQQIPALGLDLDPRYHQAILRGPGPEGKVIAEFQKGYRLEDRVLRPSLVQVGDGADQTTSKPEPAEGPATSEGGDPASTI